MLLPVFAIAAVAGGAVVVAADVAAPLLGYCPSPTLGNLFLSPEHNDKAQPIQLEYLIL